MAETAWAEIRRAYETGPETVARLAERYAVSARGIYRRAKEEGWRPRSTRGPGPAKKKPGVNASAGEAGTRGLARARAESACRSRRPTKQAMIARLYKAIDDKLKRLEARMGSGREISAAESEREARELGVMIRNFEKVTEFATEIENRRKPAAPKRISAADAERMRAEIAERLERLTSQGNARPGSGETE